MALRTNLALWFNRRSAREIGLMLAACGLGVVWLVVVAIWQPLRQHQLALSQQIDRYTRALAVLQSHPPTLAEPKDGRTVNAIIAEEAASYDLVIRRIEATAKGADVELDEAGFETVVLWLDTIEQRYGLRVATVALTRRPKPGTVITLVELER